MYLEIRKYIIYGSNHFQRGGLGGGVVFFSSSELKTTGGRTF